MLRLIVLSGPDEGRDASLTDGSRIGRGPASGLRLSDRSISREHAAISQRGDQWYVVDMGSTNGLWDGDERVDEVLLADGSVVRLGEVRLEARIEMAAGQADAAPEPKQPDAEPSTKQQFSGSILGADAQAEKAKPEASMEFSVGGGAMPVADTEDELEIEWADEDADEVPAPGPADPAGPAAKPAVRDLQREELLRNMQTNKGGLARADLSQLPVWMRALLILGVLAASGAVFYFVMQAVLATRS